MRGLIDALKMLRTQVSNLEANVSKKVDMDSIDLGMFDSISSFQGSLRAGSSRGFDAGNSRDRFFSETTADSEGEFADQPRLKSRKSLSAKSLRKQKLVSADSTTDLLGDDVAP